MAVLTTIEGVGTSYADDLKKAGITSTEALLEKGSTPQGRKELSRTSGINEALLLKWVNHCDLYRIKGVGEEYADLLEAAGVDTVVELAQRNGANLFQRMEALNNEKRKVRKMPTQSQVEDWIAQARTLPRMVTY